MVYGNIGDESGTGVAFTRDPATGENVFYGEFLVNAQGEDVVAGVRTPRPVAELADVFPPAYAELLEVRKTLERELRDMQDFEFTVEKGRLYMLQTRNGKRTGLAAIRIAVDMVEEGLITADEALMRVEPEAAQPAPAADLLAGRACAPRWTSSVSSPRASPPAPAPPPARSSSTRPTPRRGRMRGEKVLLVRIETSPEDIRGMDAAQGILTARGGMTSHAALVARQMGKVCVVGCEALDIDYVARTMKVDGHDGATRATGSPSTASPARSSSASSRRGPPRCSRSCSRRSLSAGRLVDLQATTRTDGVGGRSSGSCASAPTPTSPTRRPTPSPSAPRASACAAPSTCSSAATASRPCAR